MFSPSDFNKQDQKLASVHCLIQGSLIGQENLFGLLPVRINAEGSPRRLP
jgi:hypothetical protein